MKRGGWSVLVLAMLVAAVALAIRLRPALAPRVETPAPSTPPAAPDGAALELVTAAGTRRFTLAELRAALPAETVSVGHDPSYAGRPKRYVGFALDRVLALAGLQAAPGEVLYFQAADGFRATLSEPATSDGVRGVVAFADADVPGGWEPLGHGKEQKSPAPFYLVWSGPRPAAGEDPALRRPWPYQLVRIEVVDPRRKYDLLYPEGVAASDPVYRGYQGFVVESNGGDQCVSCHSLNLQGGTVGPELNVPRNVTEYRDEATLIAFIRNSRSFRARSAMPAYEGVLTDAQIRDILAYLRWMRGHKAAPDSTAR